MLMMKETVKKIILPQMEKNAINVMIRMLECQDVVVNAVLISREIMFFYVKVDVLKDILNLNVYVKLVKVLIKVVKNAPTKIIILMIIQELKEREDLNVRDVWMVTLKKQKDGVYLVYKKATPTTEDGTPYQHLQICDPDGTEEFVSTGIAPVGHYSAYPENQVAKLDGLPKDFSTLIAPTEKTNTATRNYTAGSLLIIDNVLYKVTANIANGGTITVGRNVTATTLAEVIAALS